MISLSVQNLCLSFGTDVILKDVSFAINDRDRVGIVGVNGAGKSSLFRIIAGEYEASSGSVFVQKGHAVGMLEQNPSLISEEGGLSCLEYMYKAFPELISLEEEIRSLELLLTASDKDTEKLGARLASLNERYAALGGLEFRSRCRGMLLRLGFDEDIIERRVSTLSGGQYTRLALARLLAWEPDILMLDEPTNHLDIDALMWLESYISTYKKTVLIISHDRYFLDRTTDKTLHIQNGYARLFPGSYSKSKEMQQQEAASLEKRYKEQQKEIAKIKANIEFQRRCNREHNFVTIRSKEKQLARMELVELAPKAPKNIRMSFDALSESAGDVILAKDLSFSYGSTPLIKNLSFLVRRGERVLFLGPNGSGKSTLMKLLNSLLTPSGGKIILGYNIEIGYYDQENRGLDNSKTVFSFLHDEYPEKTDLEIRSTLALFLFCKDDIDKPIHTLSGGERARLTLAKLMLKKVNLLIMDEPTNHLDAGSAEALEEALLAFSGTIVAVSHDRYFINRIATRIIELAPDTESGMIDYPLEEYDEAFTEYMRIRGERNARAEVKKEEKTSSSSKTDYEEKKRENARRRSEERKLEAAKRKASELEEELSRLEEELFGSAATDYVRAAEIDKRKEKIENELMELYELLL